MKHYLSVGDNVKDDGSNAQFIIEFDDVIKDYTAVWIKDALKPWSEFAVKIEVQDGKRVFEKTDVEIVTGKQK